MSFHYEIEKDELYLEGIEKGIEKGIEQGIEIAHAETVSRMLRQDKFSTAEIALLIGVDENFVRRIALHSALRRAES